ncbi:MAG: coiled-coil domain-containing protein, partial [Planctomycetota bacterium]
FEGTIKELVKGLHEVQAELAALREKSALLEKKDGDLSERKLLITSRMDVLQKYRDRLEGVGEGAAQVVREASREGGTLQGVVGLLADRIQVQPNHVKAVEAALNRVADAVVLEDFEGSLKALAFLQETHKGRGNFLCRPASEPEAPPAETFSYPGVIGRAADLVECAEEDKALIAVLLGNTLLVESLDVAVGLRDLLGDRFTFATLAGEILDPIGLLAGGVALKGRMAHATELEELGQEILRIRVEVDEVQGERKELGKTVGGVEEKEGNLRHQVYDLRHEIVARQKARDKVVGLSRELRRQIEILGGEIARIASDQEVREREAAEAKAALERLVARAGGIREELEGLEAKQEEVETRRAEEELRFHNLRVEHRGISERVRHQTDTVNRISRGIREREGEYRDAVARIDENGKKSDSLRREITTLDEEIISATRGLGQVMEESQRLHEACDELQQDVSLKSAEVKNTRDLLEEVKGTLNDLHLKESEYRVRIEETVSRTAEELSVVLPELYEDFDDDACDWADIDQKVLDLKEKIGRLGNVNLDAIQECDEEESRFEYLSSQKEDLVLAKNQLLAVIRKIDRRSKELFVKSFADIRESFKGLFRKLFGGGKADVFLVDESDILESPVEVMAQPKDKKPSSISLLSGGEKVMTCIALLFAIFKAKPSPFCILDEVDAALDEGNIDRFVGMLSDFVKGSQFIIITHNKKTMMVGDAIFGVTMQEPGVSKKVSLRIEEAKQVVDEDQSRREAAAHAAKEGADEAAPIPAGDVLRTDVTPAKEPAEEESTPAEDRPEGKKEEEPVPAQTEHGPLTAD